MKDEGGRMKRKILRAIALFILLPLAFILGSGCTVDEKKEVALYRGILDRAGARHVEYHAGEPLTLTDALLLANQHNERLMIAGEDFVQALIDKDRAASAFYPTITLVPSFSVAQAGTDFGGRALNGGTTGDPTELASRSSFAAGNKNWDTPVNTNWNIFRGGRDVANVRRSQAEIDRFRAILLDLKSTVLLDVASAYYSVLRAEESVRVLEGTSQLQDARVSEMRARDVVGAARKLDVAQAEAQAANTRAQLVAARTDVQNARALLAFLTNAPVLDAPLVDRLRVPDDAMDMDAMLQRAWTGRQDLVAAQAQVRAAVQAVQSAVGAYYPSVSINFNYYLSRMTVPNDSLWNGLLSINLPIFTGGRLHADVRTAMSQVRQARAQEQLLRRQIEEQTRQSIYNLQSSSKRIAELNVAVDAARQALDVAKANSRAGMGIYLAELVAQDQFLLSRLALATELFNLKLNYLNLLRVIGDLQEPPAEGPTSRPATRLETTTEPTTRP
jgi:outer membrane protein TolC